MTTKSRNATSDDLNLEIISDNINITRYQSVQHHNKLINKTSNNNVNHRKHNYIYESNKNSASNNQSHKMTSSKNQSNNNHSINNQPSNNQPSNNQPSNNQSSNNQPSNSTKASEKFLKIDGLVGPHHNVYKLYHWMDVRKLEFFHSVLLIQRWWRRWRGEVMMRRMRMKDHVANLTSEYKAFCEKMLSLYNISSIATINPDLKNMESYWDWKTKLNMLFDSLVDSTGSSMLSREKFGEFYRRAGIFATETEIDKGLKVAFKGCSSKARIMFIPVHLASTTQHTNDAHVTMATINPTKTINSESTSGSAKNEKSTIAEILSCLYMQLRCTGYNTNMEYACVCGDGTVVFDYSSKPYLGSLLDGRVNMNKFNVDHLKSSIQNVQKMDEDHVVNGNDVIVVVMCGDPSTFDDKHLHRLKQNLLKLIVELEEETGSMVYLAWGDVNSSNKTHNSNENINKKMKNIINMIEIADKRHIYKVTPEMNLNIRMLADDIQRSLCGACTFCRIQKSVAEDNKKVMKFFTRSESDDNDNDDDDNYNDDDDDVDASSNNVDCEDDAFLADYDKIPEDGDDDDVHDNYEDDDDGDHHHHNNHYDDEKRYVRSEDDDTDAIEFNKKAIPMLKLGLTKDELLQLSAVLKVPKFFKRQLKPDVQTYLTDQRSTWMRPVVDGRAVCLWANLKVNLSDLNITKDSQFLTCLRLVFASKLEREKYMNIPIVANQGLYNQPDVEKVVNVDRAMELALQFINKHK